MPSSLDKFFPMTDESFGAFVRRADAQVQHLSNINELLSGLGRDNSFAGRTVSAVALANYEEKEKKAKR